MDTSQRTGQNPCSLNDALHSVDRNLVYDPITKKLCLKLSNNYSALPNKQISYNNSLNLISHTKNPTSFEDDLKNESYSSANYSSPSNNSDKTYQLIDNFTRKLDLDDDFPYDLDWIANNQDLINENKLFIKSSIRRPDNLPPKSKDEERKHRAQFLEILQHAKRKDLKERKSRKEFCAKQVQQEKQIHKAIQIWTNEILPCWSTSHTTKRVQDLWWLGIPSSIRPKVWNLVIGNDLNITEQLFHICVKRSKDKIWTKQFLSRRSSNPMSNGPEHIKTHRRASSHSINLERAAPETIQQTLKSDSDEDDDEQNENIAFLIKLDVLRTFPQLGLFQETGPYHESLCDILSAYVVYRPDIGYCQGMSFLAAMLLLNCQSPFMAFKCLANLLNNDLLLAFYSLNQHKMQIIYSFYDRQFHSLLPNLARHFQQIGLTTDLFFMYQLYTIFARSLSLDCVSRVWDLFLRDGNEFIFRASLAILSMYQNELIQLEFVDSARFLSNLPDDMDTEKYFETIHLIKLIPPKLSALMANHNYDNQTPKISTIQTSLSNHNTRKSRYSSLFINKFLRF